MRSIPAFVAAVTGLGLVLTGGALTGCARREGSLSRSASVAPSGAPPSSSSCLVGTWRTTGFDGQASAATTAGTAGDQLAGGAGIELRVEPNGDAVVDFAGMQPVEVAGQGEAGEVTGLLTYGGQFAGGLVLPSDTASEGNWRPRDELDLHAMTITIDVRRPVPRRLVENLPITQYVGDEVAGIDSQPLLRAGNYRCVGETLMLTMSDGTISGIWKLRRT